MADVPAPRPTRPGRRDPGGGPITRQRVLACALEIIDRDGIEGLSMRRLGKALGRDPMALYRHAPSKAALLDALAESVLEQLEVDIGDVDWATQLREVARGFRRLALAHPQMVPLLVTRPLSTPLGLRPLGTLRPLEDTLTLLTRAGFTGADALHVYRAFFGFLYGHVLNDCKSSSNDPTNPTTYSVSDCTAYRSATSPCCGASRRCWRRTTGPPNSNAASTSSSRV